MAVSSSDVLGEQVIDELVSQGSLDFDSWTLLISSFEQLYRDNLSKITLVYDSFLSEFPLCHGYWKKYAEHLARLCSAEDVVQIYEREVEAVPYSVSAWVDYCTFGISFFEDPVDVRRLFDRGLSFVGKDYLCHNLWDKYIEYEYSHKHWNSLASIYIQILKFPTKKLHQYYESFKKLIAIWKEGIEFQENSGEKEQLVHDTDSEIVACKDAEIYHVINDLIDPSTRAIALQKYISTGEYFYQRACDLDVKVHNFERNIRRPYFHVKSLDDTQLQNWHQYLDLVEMEGDFDWAVKLYERCLISCAHYPEFWMRYVDYVESKGGKEIAADALNRATHIFLKNVPEIHLFNAWFKEKMNDIDGAHDAFLQCDQEFGPCFIERIRRKANMERRMGNYASASYVYKQAFDLAAKNRPDALPMLYVHYARLQYMITDSMEATRQVLLNGIQHVPHSKLLLKELLFFALMHDGARQVEILESVMDQALAIGTDVPGGLSCKDREDISRLYLEFIDSCGSIHDVRRAWSRHLKLFSHLIREQTTLMKPANAGAMANMVVEGRADALSTYPAKKLLEENVDKSKQDDQLQLDRGNSNQNGLGIGLSLVTKTLVKDECKANESGAGLLYQASDERNAEEVVKDRKTHANQEVEVHNRKPRLGKPDSGEGHSLKSQDDKYPREASQSNASTRAGGHDNDEIPSTSSPASPQENNATETCNESSCPSTVRHKDPSLALSPEHTSDKEGNQRHFKSSGKSCSRISSPGGLTERLERSLSPRRRNSQGYLDDRRRRERSLSPRRRNSRWQPDDCWQRDRRNRRFSWNQDNSRGQRDGRMQNQNVGVAGNTGKLQNAQQQSNVGYPQAPTNQYAQLPINEQYGNVQNNQLYHNMWQYYNYNQQQLTLQQSTLGSQQLQQQVQPQQLQQQIQNPAQQQYMQTPQQPQQTPPNQQQLLNLPYQQQQLYQQLQLQQKLTNEQPESLQQQFFQQQMYLQPHPQQQLQQPVHVQQKQQQQTQLQQQDEVYLQQKQQEQQQSYQYQQAQQQQYMLYLQQLHQYQQSQQQLGIPPEQKSFQQQQKLTEELPKELPQIEHKNEESQIQQDNGSMQVDSVGCLQQQQGQGSEHLISGALTPDELPEIEGTDC